MLLPFLAPFVAAAATVPWTVFAAGTADRGVDVDRAPGFLRHEPLSIEPVDGGTMIVTGGEGVASGFVHLPGPDAAARWVGPAVLRSLGGDWYVTV